MYYSYQPISGGKNIRRFEKRSWLFGTSRNDNNANPPSKIDISIILQTFIEEQREFKKQQVAAYLYERQELFQKETISFLFKSTISSPRSHSPCLGTSFKAHNIAALRILKTTRD